MLKFLNLKFKLFFEFNVMVAATQRLEFIACVVPYKLDYNFPLCILGSNRNFKIDSS